ncbi:MULTISPECIES: hypothetical protein [Staphylococcus]|uniref:hypothetical protein n=1 Tax=Staphylococcus TaxID=1279 RepID=UPI00066B3415|nr:hypothetical protein [Staphylococcus hominis]MCI2841880.1 hypothetical protein [Staphylococcus hominis]MCI2851617.1 hypothetical protein [Staphylococcus hominis]MCI2858853.1 hypothetical protein [Staphylococcus hominis]MCI2879067.1 hypothetical protein [Staphylococcus hominis]MDS3883781.1 hypothetical protein [Staphylococcus hominis]
MNSETLFNSFIEGYKKEAANYDFLGDSMEDAFPLLKFGKYLNYCLFNVPKDIFHKPSFLVIVDNMKDLEEIKTVNNNDFEDKKRVIMDTDKRKRFEIFLKEYHKELFEKNVLQIIDVDVYIKDLSSVGKIYAEFDFKDWRRENQTPVDSYDHEKISPYSHLDYEGIIANFDSKKYRDDFEYQMNQANECYKRKLFLPAAATLSVALETLLMAICDKENVKLKSKDATDTMMNYLGERLLQEGKINYRMHKRIDVTYSLRNSVSHSNPGEVSKADCQIILSCIKTLIDSHYSK